MRATLIFPGITTCGWNCFGRTNNSEANFIPYGLAYISAYARDRGHHIDGLDLRTLSGWDEFEQKIGKRSPGIFGISSMSVDFGMAKEAIERIKKIDKKSIVILGGVHATVVLDDIKAIEEIDHIICGEGEISFSELLTQLEEGKSSPRIISGTKPDIDTLPYPDRELFHFQKGEMKMPWLPHMPPPFVSIIASRGCPFQCTFCQPAERAVFGGKAQIRSVESVIEELKYMLERYQFKSLLVHDDLFTFYPRWIEKFCTAYRENNFDQIFTCQARADFIVKNKELVGYMAESGLSCFMIGFESGSQRLLDFIKKGVTLEMNREAVEICRGYGIKIFANYMFGLPTETPEEVYKTIEFIRWARPEYPSPAFFTPYPGSELYDYCLKHDLSLINSYKSYARNPTEPKIRGVDYSFLNFAVERSREYKMDEQLDRLKGIPVNNSRLKRLKLTFMGKRNQFIRKQALLEKKDQLARMDVFFRNKYLADIGSDETKQNRRKTHGPGKHGRILITGGTGFIGSSLASRLHEKGHDVTVLTRDPRHSKAEYLISKGVEVLQGNVEDRKIVDRLNGFSVIYHLAIFPGTSGNKMFEVNVAGTENMLQVAVRNEVEKFIYASSIEAQGPGGAENIPLTEKFPCHPVSEYGRSKLQGEEKVSEYSERYGLNSVIARIGNVYGPRGLSFIYPMTEAIVKENSLMTFLHLFKDRYVQPIHIEDLTELLVAAIDPEMAIEGIYNFTGNAPVLIGEWFRILASFLGKEARIGQILEKERGGEDLSAIKTLHPHIDYFLSGDEPRIHRMYSDEKIRERAGHYQQFNLPRGVASTLEWYDKNKILNKLLVKR